MGKSIKYGEKMNVANSALTDYFRREKTSKVKLSSNNEGQEFRGFMEIAVLSICLLIDRDTDTFFTLRSNLIKQHKISYETGITSSTPSPLHVFHVRQNASQRKIMITIQNPFFICAEKVSNVEFYLTEIFSARTVNLPFYVHFVYRSVR